MSHSYRSLRARIVSERKPAVFYGPERVFGNVVLCWRARAHNAVKNVKKMSWVIGLMTALVIMSVYSVAAQSGEAPRVIETRQDAIDTALNYILRSHGGLSELGTPSAWVDQGLVYEDILGYSVVQYANGEWTAKVGNAVVQEPVYDVEIVFTGELSFVWKGTVDRSGNVVETEFAMEG